MRIFLPNLMKILTLPMLVMATASAQDFPPAQVEVAAAENRVMAPMMSVSGTVVSLNDSQIATEVEGILTTVAPVGSNVSEGDVIATIDSRLLDIALRRANAALKRLEADLVFRNQDVERFRDLANRDNASKSRLQEVIAQRDMVEQDVLDARAQLEQAQGDKNRAQIRAPFSGTVVARLANKGEYLNVGATVLRLVDTRDIEVALPAPLTIIPFLKTGMTVDVEVAGLNLQLPIRTVVLVGDQISRMVEVRLDAAQTNLITGTPATVQLPRGETVEGVAVPRDAVVLKSGSMFVFRVNDDMTAERVPVDVRQAVGLWVPVPTGIAAGDKIVVRGAERLQPGQSVALAQ